MVRLSDEERQHCKEVVNRLQGSSQKAKRANNTAFGDLLVHATRFLRMLATTRLSYQSLVFCRTRTSAFWPS